MYQSREVDAMTPAYFGGGRFYKHGNRKFPPPGNFVRDYRNIPELSTAGRREEFLESLHRTGVQWFEGELLERKRIRDRLLVPPFYGRALDPREAAVGKVDPQHQQWKKDQKNATRHSVDRFLEAEDKWNVQPRNSIYNSVHYSRDGVQWKRWGPWNNM